MATTAAAVSFHSLTCGHHQVNAGQPLGTHFVVGPAEQRTEVVVSLRSVGHDAAAAQHLATVPRDVHHFRGCVEGPSKGVHLGVSVHLAGHIHLLATRAAICPLLPSRAHRSDCVERTELTHITPPPPTTQSNKRRHPHVSLYTLQQIYHSHLTLRVRGLEVAVPRAFEAAQV